MKKKTIIFVFGTRPEFIKMLPVILEAKKNKNIKAVACSTGQHKDMLESLYKMFDFKPDIDFRLMKSNQSLSYMHSETMNGMNTVIENLKPDWVVVQGDTTTAHAAAMAAFYQKVPVAHVEAGLRTYDLNAPFPEELNRRAIGLVAKAHLCPTKEAAENIRKEKIDKSSYIEITGNTGIDTLNLVAKKTEESPELKKIFSDEFHYLNDEKFILSTVHRRESFGDPLRDVFRAFLTIVKSRPINILCPVHPNPNVKSIVNEIFQSQFDKTVFWAGDPNNKVKVTSKGGKIFLVNPLDYPSLVYAMKNSSFLMTDSGGLQEEGPSFAKKILVLRGTTERPEGVHAGFSKLVGTDYYKIVEESYRLIDSEKHWDANIPLNPYGDGRSSERIMNILSDSSPEYNTSDSWV
ncbi:MAG: UDP-N-acetylglucosamine 2-epimerase [Pseudobdellovibrio sp.]|jgi:UDP-N-acetylglucosamine 2-epimerase (non-hydrolysing)|nr:UDP-N-acetylglucosamine 2-epimerase [Pseudobdellovibrio sp.]